LYYDSSGKKSYDEAKYYTLVLFDLKSTLVDVIEAKLMTFLEKSKDNLLSEHQHM